jgi:hypothetical protein
VRITAAQFKAIGQRKPVPRAERDVLKAILAYLRLVPEVVAWRTNSGAAMMRVGKKDEFQPVRFGFKGLADIIGWRSIIRHESSGVDKSAAVLPGLKPPGEFYVAKFIAIEVKAPGKQPTREQAAFLAAVTRAGGLAIVARSVDDVRKALGR